VKREELKPALRWRIKDMLDYHVDDATIDVLDVPVPPNVAQRAHYMYAVAAKNEAIRVTVERFQNAGLPLAVIDIPDIAQRNVAALYENEERGVAAVTFDAHGMLLTVNFDAELYLSRRLDITAAQLVCTTSSTRMFTGLRRIDSMIASTMWPPSRTGIGSMFRIARFTFKITLNQSASCQPRSLWKSFPTSIWTCLQKVSGKDIKRTRLEPMLLDANDGVASQTAALNCTFSASLMRARSFSELWNFALKAVSYRNKP